MAENGGTKNSYVLAMYDVRGKQEYIYGTPKIKQIAGASWIIRDVYKDYLFSGDIRIAPGDTAFTQKGFEDHLQEGYQGEVVYNGGGNFFVLYKDMDTYLKINRRFYKKLLESVGTLRVLSTCIEGVDFDDYKGDERKLREKHRKAEQRESLANPINALPIVQVDYYSSLPLTAIERMPVRGSGEKTEPVKVSTENAVKYKKFNESNKEPTYEAVKKLDSLIEGKGKDSHLAVVYIDGNGMGGKVESCLKGIKSYEDCIAKLRNFSAAIQEEYIDFPKKAIEKEIKSRFVVYAGDEITFICNAKDAFRIVNLYFEEIRKKSSGSNALENSSCAGVAIFNSHAPFAEAYRIAEECCETGKRLMKEKGVDSACFMDFHYCQGAIGTSLEDIRKREGTESFCQPWLLGGIQELGIPDKKKIRESVAFLRGIARSNSKELLYAAKESQAKYEKELERIMVHHLDKKFREKWLEEEENKFLKDNRGLIYRIMLVYDLWFREEKTKNA